MLANVFQNVWEWVQTNLPAVLSGTTLVTFLAVVFYIVRLVKELRGNSTSNAELGKSLKETKAVQKTADAVKQDTTQIIAGQGEASDILTIIDFQLRAILEVLQTDINSRRNLSDNTRTAINNIIMNAKYQAGISAREEIAKQAQEMAEKAKKVAEEIAVSASKTAKIVKPETEDLYKIDFRG